jgi:iron complex outermembrane receptor protein
MSVLQRAIRMSLIRHAGSLGLLLLALPMPASGQDQDAQLGAVVVTGSRIRQERPDGASPVEILDADEMIEKGFNNVMEALGSLTQNSGGVFDAQAGAGTGNAYTESASFVDLRNMGSSRTLVLIDGRRMPVFPISNGGDNFVNLNTIPLAAVERIEVVTDGGSAVYGSDAIAGVVNVILRKEIERPGLTFKALKTEEGGYDNGNVQFFAGAGSGDTRFTFVADYYRQDELVATDRSYLIEQHPRYATYIGTNMIQGLPAGTYTWAGRTATLTGGWNYVNLPDPNCAATFGGLGYITYVGTDSPFGQCVVDIGDSMGLAPDMTRFSALGTMRHSFASGSELTLKLDYSSVDSTLPSPSPYWGRYYGGARSGSVVPGMDGYNAYPSAFVEGLPNFHGIDVYPGWDDTYGGWEAWSDWRVWTQIPGYEKFDDEAFGLTAELAGRIGEHDWTAGIGYHRLSSVNLGAASLTSPVDYAITQGVDLYAAPSAAFIEEIRSEYRIDGTSENITADFVLTGELARMPAGPLKYAAVLDFQRSEMSSGPSALMSTFEFGIGTSGVEGSRNQYGIGAELSMPLHERLQLGLAARYDYYDDDSSVSGGLTPMARLEWRPAGTLLLRATAGRTFRAPDMQRIYSSDSRSFVSSYSAFDYEGAATGACTFCINWYGPWIIEAEANPDLTEEKGTNFNLGFVYSPRDWLKLTVDAWRIELEDQVFDLDYDYVARNYTQFPDRIIRDAPTPYNSLGPIVRVLTGSVNFSKTETDGIDASVSVSVPAGSGQFSTTLAYSHIGSYEFQRDATTPMVEDPYYVKDRGSLSLGWENGTFGANAFVSHTGRTPELYDPATKVDSWTTGNLNGFYRFGESLTLRLGVVNVTDEAPPRDSTIWRPGYNPFFYNVYGRRYTLQADYQF